MKKRLLSIMLTAALAITSAMPVLADEIVVSADDEAVVIEAEESTDDSVEIVEADDVVEEVAEEIAVDALDITNEEAIDTMVAGEVVATEVIDSYEVTVKIAAGVVPADANVAIVKVADEDVNESTEEGTAVKAITFDVVVTDVDGNVVDVDKSAVEVSVKSVAEDGTYAVVSDADVISEDGVDLAAEDGKPSYTITIIQPNAQDNKAPILKSAKMLKDTYYRGETYQLQAKITDDISKFDTANFYFKNTSTGETTSVYVYSHRNYYYDNGDYVELPKDTYMSSSTVSNLASVGTYKIDYVQVRDNAGNVRYYSDTLGTVNYASGEVVKYEKLPKSVKNLKFKVVNGESEFTPSLDKITISPTKLTIKRGDKKEFKITAQTSCEQGTIELVSVTLTNKKKDTATKKNIENTYRINLYPKSEGSSEYVSSNNMWGSDYYAGTWKITDVRFFSQDGVEKKAASSKYKNKSIKVTVTGKEPIVPAGAKVKDLKFDDGKTVTIPKDGGVIVPFTVNLTGAKAGQYIDVNVTLYDKKTKQSRVINCSNYEYEYDSEAHKTTYKIVKKDVAKGSIYIDQYESVGNYIVSAVSVNAYKITYSKRSSGDYSYWIANYNTVGSRNYYLKDPTTGKNTLTPQMKKVKMTIKKK